MKRNNIGFFLLAGLAIISLASCQNQKTDTPVNSGDTAQKPGNQVLPDDVVSLKIDENPLKLTYKEGEKFDPKGLKMTATLGDGSTENAEIGDCEIYPSGELTKDVTEVRIVYFEGEAKVAIKVEPNAVTSLSMSNEPAIYSYIKGSKLNLTGLSLKAQREDGSVVDGISNYSILLDDEEYELSKPLDISLGEHTLSFKYFDQKVDYKIFIFDGGIVEAENLLTSDAINEESKDFTEPVIITDKGNFGRKSDGFSSGKGYLGGIRKGDLMRIHVWSEEKKDVELVMRAASASVKQYQDGTWISLQTNDLPIDDVCSIDVNGKAYDLGTGKYVLPGSISRYYDEGKGDAGLWTKWMDVSLGDVSLAKGDNTITIDTRSAKAFKDLNIDRIETRDVIAKE